jgi:hypothetical protein
LELHFTALYCGFLAQIRRYLRFGLAHPALVCNSSSEMCSSIEERPPELRNLIAALISRKSVFQLKARLLKGVRAELRSAKDSGLTWLVIWGALRDAGYPGAYPNFCRTAAALLRDHQPRPMKGITNLRPPSVEKEVSQPNARESDRGRENKEKPAWQIQREETMARLDREAELNRQREAQWQSKKVFKPSVFVGRSED